MKITSYKDLVSFKPIADYVEIVESRKYPMCQAQIDLIKYVKKCFLEEDLYIDTEQAEKYFTYEKYFEYKLFEWEKFVFVLHNCTYNSDGHLRWPILFLFVGRGTGKNGYLAFEDFCLLTPTNGVKNYDIDIFATSEKQAKTSWEDVYNVLENNRVKMSRFFYWNKEYIENLQTHSVFRFQTANYKSKDGGRPGKVDIDEEHAYESYKLIDVAVTGLGKVRHPRQTRTSTNGLIRGGPLDDDYNRGLQILAGEVYDNGMIPFMCYAECDEDIESPEMWAKANPSLPYRPDLLYEIKLEFGNYLANKIANISFAVKRMNVMPKSTEGEVTSWENILATNQELEPYLPKIQGMPCTVGFDYMKTTDLLSAGLLFNVDGKDIWITHSWVCTKSADLPRIQAPLREWEAAGLLTFVDGPEISPDIPVYWVAQKLAELQSQPILTGIDYYRYTLLARALKEVLYCSSEKGYENIMLVRPSNEMMCVPTITSQFVNQNIIVGDNPLFRWAVNNSKQVTSAAGNITYGKIEPKSRKTDPFKAYVAAKCAQVKAGASVEQAMAVYTDLPGVFIY